MARRRSILSSRTSRADLPPSDAPEWELVSPGIRLGYRRGRGSRGRGGAWLAAARKPDGKRVQMRLGTADDVAPADGASVLTHDQAKELARKWAKTVAREQGAIAEAITVDVVLDRYLEAREAEGMKSLYDTRLGANVHIRPKLGKLLVANLTVDRLRRWRDEMARSPRRIRSKRTETVQRYIPLDLSDPEAVRRRRDTANRILTMLKAALNWAHAQRLVEDDTAWRLVKPFPGTGAARVRFLNAEEQTALLQHATGALWDLVAAALVTGARFGELARLQVQDFDAENGSVFIAESKSGKPRHVPLPAGGAALFRRLAEGRGASEFLLIRENGEPWRKGVYKDAFKDTLKRAGLENITLHELRHSYASTMVRGGAPLMVVAQALGHSDTRMVDKHYAHLAPSYVADTIRRLAPDIAA